MYRGDCCSNIFEIKRSYTGISANLRGEALLIMPVGLTNYAEFKYAAGFLNDYSRIVDLG